MFWITFLLLSLCKVAVICFKKPEVPCKIDDVKCMTDQGQDALITAVFGDPENDVRSLDPMQQKTVTAHLPGIRFTLTESSIAGFKDAQITEFKMSPRKSLLINMWLPRYEINGNYEIDYYILNKPIYTKGWFSINATNVEIKMDANYKMYQKYGKHYIKISDFKTAQNFEVNRNWDAYVYYDDKKIPNAMLQQFNDNRKQFSDSWKDPLLTANMKTFFKNYNKVIARYAFNVMIEI